MKNWGICVVKTHLIVALLAIVSGATAYASDGKQSSREQGTPSQPIFLLSERTLGSDGKVCFLSNGLQIRISAAEVCPYALKAPPFVEQSQQPAPIAQPSIIQKPSIEPGSKLITGSAQKTAPQPSPILPTPQRKEAAPAPTQSVLQNSQTTGQAHRLQAEAPASQKPETKPDVQINRTTESEDDEIAAKAIRRCERIGFAKGSAPFKACALEQIRLITVGKP
jgi:hypothetical protein